MGAQHSKIRQSAGSYGSCNRVFDRFSMSSRFFAPCYGPVCLGVCGCARTLCARYDARDVDRCSFESGHARRGNPGTAGDTSAAPAGSGRTKTADAETYLTKLYRTYIVEAALPRTGSTEAEKERTEMHMELKRVE